MKKLLVLSVLSITLLCSCEESIEEPIPEGEFSFYVTGFKRNLTVDFSSKGRTDQSHPEDVHQLHIQILDEDNMVIHERFHYDYNDYSEDENGNNADFAENHYDDLFNLTERGGIPDTIFIPALPSGHYNVIAATAHIGGYNHYIDYADDGTFDETDIEPYYTRHSRIETSVVSDGPIYVGQESIVLEKESQEVIFNMTNVSAKITIANASDATDAQGGAEVMFHTLNNQYFDLQTSALLPIEYDYAPPIFTYINGGEAKKEFYILPKSLMSLSLNFWHHSFGTQYTQEFELDPQIDLNIGDAVTFTLNIEEILRGGGASPLQWEEIEWNDLGEVSIP